MMPAELPPPPQVAGTSLSGTSDYIISADDNRAICKSVGVEPAADGTAHPIFFYIATQVGMGSTVAGLCEICEFNLDDGPLMASTKVEFFAPLKVSTPYRVHGEILSLTRKASRKLGVMDLLAYELRLQSSTDGVVLQTVNKWVLPRRVTP